MKGILSSLLFVCFCFCLQAQIGGNQVYSNHNNNRQRPAPVTNNSIVSTDSTLMINAKVLLNKRADHYLLHVGLSQEAETVVACNEKINARIERLKKKMEEIGIEEEDMYVDFIAQTRVYDHKLEGNTVTEYFDGFNIKKNLIIKVMQLEEVDELIVLCSTEEVFDIIKVDYVNTDIEKIYDELFRAAMEAVERKKKQFLKYSSVKLTGKHRVKGDQFQVYPPKNLYQEYSEAFETSQVTYNYSSSYVKKTLRKHRTHYYESMQNNIGVDKVLDEISPEVGIQYLLSLGIIYELD